MALTDSKKMKIVTLLGWPGKTLVASSTHYNTLIVARLENLTPEIETLVKGMLTKVDELDAKLVSSMGKAGLKRIGDIEFYGNGQSFTDLKKERKRILKDMSDIMDIAYMKSGGVNIGVCV